MVTVKAMLIHAPEQMRKDASEKTPATCVFTSSNAGDPRGTPRHTPRSLARRWLNLDAYGIGRDTAAEILIVAGDNPERIHTEAAFAKLAGISPVPTASGRPQLLSHPAGGRSTEHPEGSPTTY